ncbi:hypothetical protein HUN01_23400 [Nostoc edaphicum CCNP1411]|uniref:Uncharacterized protein n=1 Tax=Nostoc edaphicum CCNP1411 TaxID=1472755 RepID=A0A7D7R6E1_9NOSO|nr:hypothetical protein [Nostoc edaphicum]QMS90386.1 hypothetical protein HUN01_23400 [Nostoc edaphicum CCNP1411]
MTIPLFSRDTGRSLLIRRGTDSYSDEGRRQDSVAIASPQAAAGCRRLKYSVGNYWRRYANKLTLIARNLQPALDEVFHVRS